MVVDRASVSLLIESFRVDAEAATDGVSRQLGSAEGRPPLARVIGAFYVVLDDAGRRLVRNQAAVTSALAARGNDPVLQALHTRVAAQATVWTALAEGFARYVRDASAAERGEAIEVGVAPAVIVVAIAGVAIVALSVTGVAWAVVHWQTAQNLGNEIEAVEKNPALAEAFANLNRTSQKPPELPDTGSLGPVLWLAAGGAALAALAWFTGQGR